MAPHPVRGTSNASSLALRAGQEADTDSALLLSHPGHELRIYGFVEQVRPLVCVLTDGSGRAASARIATTARAVEAIGAELGKLFGRFRDRDIYDAVRAGTVSRFTALAAEIGDLLVARGVSRLVSDAPEHVILTHDLLAAVADAAVSLAARRGHAVAHYDFVLHAHPDSCPALLRESALRYTLDDAALARKRDWAMRYSELAPEIAHDRALYGEDAFRV